MSKVSGFLILGSYIEMLKKLPPKTRSAVIDVAFARTYGCTSTPAPKDKCGVLGALIDGIFEGNKDFASNGAERRAQEALRKWLKRHPGKTEKDYFAQCPQLSDLSGGQDTDRQTDKTDNPLTPDGGSCPGEIPPRKERAELAKRKPSAEEIFLGAHALGVPDEFALDFVAEMERVGWVYVNHNGVTVYLSQANWRTVLSRRWAANQEKKIPARAVAVADVPRGADGAPLDSSGPELI